MSGREIRPKGAASGEVRAPASKSVTNRHLNLALLARQPAVIERPLIAEDTRDFINALRRLGMAISGSERMISLAAGRRLEEGRIHCGASGTMLRFLVGSLTTVPGIWTLDGSRRLRQRPIVALISALRSLGARIECLGEEGFAPLRIHGEGLTGGRVAVDAGASSQYVSALMMAALGAQGRVSISAHELVSAPYVEITRRVVHEWGSDVEIDDDGTFVVTPAKLGGGRFKVEGDYSSACYLAAGAAVLGGSVAVLGLDRQSAQGDRRFFDLLVSMGAAVEWQAGVAHISGGRALAAVDCDMSDMPDQVPTRGIGSFRQRDDPNLERCASENQGERSTRLGRYGPAGGWRTRRGARRRPIHRGHLGGSSAATKRAVIETFDDHRIAMSFAVLGLARQGVEIEEPGVVGKSYPGFWVDFARCFER